MSTDPNQIRREIERTRDNLSTDVDALAYKVSPGRVVADRKQRARDAVRKVRNSVMGTASDLGDSATSAGSSLADRTSTAASSVGDAVQQAPAKARQASAGNPLAAGLIAFGVGWLVSSLVPASDRERHAAEQLKEKVGEHGDTIREHLGEAAREVRDDLREPVTHATEAVKSTATDATQAVREQGRSATHEVREHTREQVRS